MPSSTAVRAAHHHGNLREALVEGGIAMLEAGEPFSLRAVAKRVGVSQAAPYRHFADKEHLEAAMAAQGFRSLRQRLTEADAGPGDDAPFIGLALAYIAFARTNPGMYGLMFGQPCGENDERLAASAEVGAFIEARAREAFPDADAPSLATAGWALAHGLAALQISGKLVATDGETLDDITRRALAAILTVGG